ncbi:hypothetical protein [Ruegeria atlantica]|uniref:hypothetical protein n=1 Tax=Ruegeria atlantica TaxID=81569 RepID=UPI001F16C632|nr:hypothetical protein [Ruegeria atlantica]
MPETSIIANIDDQRQSAQAKVQKTCDFGQNDGKTGAPLHHFCRKFGVYQRGGTTCCGCRVNNPKNEKGVAQATPIG